MRDAQIRDLQSMADRQAVAQHNELIMLEAQMRTQAALSQVQAQSYRPILPSPPLTGAPPQIDTGRMAQIPDDRLEASNAAVQAVVRSRR
jgi:hypothetical protein